MPVREPVRLCLFLLYSDLSRSLVNGSEKAGECFMKSSHILVAGMVIAASLAISPRPALAETYDCDSSDHPARYVIYPVHAVGKAIETFVTRPIHWVVSRPKLRYIFGHTSNPKTEDYTGDFELYQRYQY